MKIENLQNGIRLLRDDTAFPLSTDAVLLADFARVPKGAAVCDLCAGGGAVGLLLLSRDPALNVTALELQREPCALMAQAAHASGVQDRFRILQGDLRRIRDLLPAGAFRSVVCNPPYYPVGSGFAPENEAQEIARTERCCTPEDVSAAAAWLLPTAGSLWLVHRPERLPDLLCALRAKGLEPKRLRLVTPHPDTAPSLILLQAVRGGRPGLNWDSPLVLANADGTPTEAYRRIYRLKETDCDRNEKNGYNGGPMTGTLYLVPTPIGNLGDISRRSVETLDAADFIAAEDTRVSLKLLNHLGLKKPLVSYHEHNKKESGPRILERLLAGQSCALVTDAGCPAISDPGEDLVRLCAGSGVPVCALPGPCAAIVALSVSALSTGRFAFEGFLPTQKKERKSRLEALRTEERTMIFYEAPHHLRTALADLHAAFGPERPVSLCRELTKLHEEVRRLTLAEAAAYYAANEPRGEYVLVVGGCAPRQETVSPEQAVARARALIEGGMRTKDAVRQAAEETGVSRNALYAAVVDSG